MTVRWRLVVFFAQLVAISFITWLATGKPWSLEAWYQALVAFAVNGQLLEPYFARPVNVLANVVFAFAFYLGSSRSVAGPGWNALIAALGFAAAASVVATIAGAGRAGGRFVRLARASRAVSAPFSAAAIYSAVFWLGLLDWAGGITPQFWLPPGAWLTSIALAAVNWQALWTTTRGEQSSVIAEALVAPSKLLIVGPALPGPGSSLSLEGAGRSAQGTVLARIRRSGDVWAAVHVDDADVCEAMVGASDLRVTPGADIGGEPVLGIADASSTHEKLVFSPTRGLQVGDVVSVGLGDRPVLYQLAGASVVEVTVKGGGCLTTKAEAIQLGRFDPTTVRLSRHRWVPEPGAPVFGPPQVEAVLTGEQFLLGHLIGTKIPVALDCDLLCEGHLAILGMTRMGKTTLALRLAEFLATSRSVIVMDQTGEYRTKGGLPPYDATQDGTTPSLSVFEPAAGKCVPDEGLALLKQLANKGYTEYKTGTPFRRVLLIDEAHQFVPEPALLGFGAPGRDSAIAFGMYIMQVRKYGITAIMISQRTAVLAKSALSQCENLIAFKSVDQTGLDYLESVLGAGARGILPTLRQGEALVSGPAVSSDGPVAVTLAIQ